MRDFSSVRRVVLKVGTNLLSSSSGVDRDRIGDIVRQISILRDRGYQVLLVSSGAVGLGAKALRHNNPVVSVPMRQACAAIGQPLLMSAYEDAFSKYNLLSAQVLITRSILNNRRSYINLRTSVSTLLAMGVVPVFNENDVVSTSEIGNVFGDNDRMSAMVASKIDAELLILLTDIDGVYTGNPKTDSSAELLRTISHITQAVLGYAKGAGSRFATGGMKTKLLAAEIAQKGGCGTVIASGYEKDSIIRIMEGEEIGSWILPEERLTQRDRWILNNVAVGALIVDDGARKALINHKSLLPSGLRGVEGVFAEGDVVEIRGLDGKAFAKAVPYFNSSELERIEGKRSDEIVSVLGGGRKDVIFRPEDLVLLDE
ncbi:MAG: glutamate 5-kinase [Candidatus Ornithospirochaeta sp.]|nr:glutamate 5-kinase [Candidatus Ornithospirochaeta sp.]